MDVLDQLRALAAQGIGLKDAEAVVRRALTPDETAAFRKAAVARRLRRAAAAQEEARKKRIAADEAARHLFDGCDRDWASKLGPKSDLERQHEHRARGREIGVLPRIRHRRVRESCRFDLLKFGLSYAPGEYEGMSPLLKRPPSPRMVRFVKDLEDRVLNGGLKHVRWPRGKGKSTWVKIAMMWAMLYGHKRFGVIVERTRGMAKIVAEEIWKRIYISPRISADFPEFAIPMRDVEMSPQRMRSQTYMEKLTYMKMDVSVFNFFKLPTMKDFPNTGGIIAFRGADQALRGINIESSRPDFFFIDDPQDEEAARNPETVAKIEKNINGAVLGSGEIDATITAVMASTPIEPDDVSETFADQNKHPEWHTETERFVTNFGPKEPMSQFLKIAAVDESAAHAFYVEHRAEIEDGVEMMDEGDFDPNREVSAYEHALNLLHSRKSVSFYAEYQMVPSRSQGIYKISPKMVRDRVNGHPMYEVPHECDQGVLAFVDVNATAGLRWEICAFGRGRVAAILAYGQYPKEGARLFPEGLPTSAIPAYLDPAIRTVATEIIGAHLVDEEGNAVRVRGVCFDGGWQTECVAASVASLNAEYADKPFVWSMGFDAKGYSRYHHNKAAMPNAEGLKAAEECHTWATANGVYLAFNSDYWKEVMQTSFLAEPLAKSSSSFYGSDPLLHVDFAQEICNEELKAKDKSTRYGAIYHWHKDAYRPNHYGDVHAGALVFGAIRGNFDPLVSVVSPETLQKVARHKKVRWQYRG